MKENEITNESTTCSHGFKTYVWKHTPVYHPAQLSLWQPLPSLFYVLALFHHCQLHVFASSGRQPSRDWILVNSLLFRLYDGRNKGPRGRRFSSSLAYFSLPSVARAINRSAVRWRRRRVLPIEPRDRYFLGISHWFLNDETVCFLELVLHIK